LVFRAQHTDQGDEAKLGKKAKTFGSEEGITAGRRVWYEVNSFKRSDVRMAKGVTSREWSRQTRGDPGQNRTTGKKRFQKKGAH